MSKTKTRRLSKPCYVCGLQIPHVECCEEGCTKPTRRRGCCAKHSDRRRRKGQTGFPLCEVCGRGFFRTVGPNGKANGPMAKMCPECSEKRRKQYHQSYYQNNKAEIGRRRRQVDRKRLGIPADGWPEKECELPGCGVMFKPFRRDTRFCSKECGDLLTTCRRYNMHPVDYRELLESNGGMCWNPACDRPASDTDHTGGDYFSEDVVVRGRLCGKCNRAEGLLGSPEAAIGLAEYVQAPDPEYRVLPAEFQKRRKKIKEAT